MARTRGMIRSYAEDVRLLKSRKGLVGLLAIVLLYLLLPFIINDSWAGVLTVAGYLAVGGIGLNLLTGYTGLPSLGTAGFVAIGSFSASYLGRPEDFGGKEWDFWKYALIAVAIGALVGFIVGMPALRLRGVYLSIATLGMVYLVLYVLKSWETVSGGNAGASMPISIPLFGMDFNAIGGADPEVLGVDLPFREGPDLMSRNHGLFWLSWAFVGVVALLCNNVIRSRAGRALQAVRDRDQAAAVVGVSLFRTKVGAFVISSAIGALAGVLYALYIQYENADDLTFGGGALNQSIQFLAVIVIGGIGTSYGPILGALLVAVTPKITGFISNLFPGLFEEGSGSFLMSEGNFQRLLYAVLIINFLIMEPNGLAGILRRFGGYFRTWPLAR
jgi:branched-chain amino acid transport system permease protein